MMPWTLDAPPGVEGEEGALDPLGYVFTHVGCASIDCGCGTMHFASAATHGGSACSSLRLVSAVLDPELCTSCDVGKPCPNHSLSSLPRACLWACPRGFIVWLRALQHQSHVHNAWGRGQWGRQRIRDVLWIRQPSVAWEVSAPPSSVHHTAVTQGGVSVLPACMWHAAWKSLFCETTPLHACACMFLYARVCSCVCMNV